MRRQRRSRGVLTRVGFATEGFVQRLAESFPHLLFDAAVHGHALRFSLPALLQCLHGINAQHGRCAHLLGFSDERLASGCAGFLCSL